MKKRNPRIEAPKALRGVGDSPLPRKFLDF